MREYDFWLTSLHNVSVRKRMGLRDYFGDSKRVFLTDEKELVDTGIIDFNDADLIVKSRKDFDFSMYENTIKKGIEFICFWEEKYPEILKGIYDPPIGLFVKGKLPSFDSGVAIVGARKCSAYGRCAAEDIARAVSLKNGVIISGMARGIDGFAHSGALKENGITVAVLGSGVDVIYPKENKGIYERILERGAVISELLPGTSPLPVFFPRRNRIISGLARAVIVIEAARRSGSLITADMALDQGKEVFALPGRITDPLCEGSNRIIEEGAGIIRSKEALINSLSEIGILKGGLEFVNNISVPKIAKLTKNEALVFGCMDYSPIGMDALMEFTKLGVSEILEIIAKLMNLGLVAEFSKNNYVKNTLA